MYHFCSSNVSDDEFSFRNRPPPSLDRKLIFSVKETKLPRHYSGKSFREDYQKKVFFAPAAKMCIWLVQIQIFVFEIELYFVFLKGA